MNKVGISYISFSVKSFKTTDLSQVRCHIELNADENEARRVVFTMAQCYKHLR